MSKLILNYRNAPYAANAAKLLKYLDKHPMAECMADAYERETIAYVRALPPGLR